TYSYAGDANFNSAGPDISKKLTVNKATPTVSVTGGIFSYDGNPHAATGFAYGVGGVSDVLSPAVTFSYAGIAPTVYGLTATARSTSQHHHHHQHRQYHDQQEGGDLDNQRQQQDLRLRRPQPAHHGQRQRLCRGGRCERELQPRLG